MKKNLMIAVILLIALNSFFVTSRVVAAPEESLLPRQVAVLVTQEVDGCSYQLFIQWTKDRFLPVAAGGLSSECLAVQVSLGKVLSPSEYDVNASLTSGFLRTTMVDEFAGVTAIINLKAKAVGRVSGEPSCGALLSGTVVFRELDLVFTFDKDPVACFHFGT